MQLKEDILLKRRGFFIDRVKGPLLRIIIRLANLYPEATMENTERKNTHILIDIRDRFLRYESNGHTNDLFRALWRLFIAEYDHDPYYRQRIDRVLEMIGGSDWEPRLKQRPSRVGRCWKEPDEHEL